MLSCKEVVRQADDFLERRLTWRGRLAMYLHLAICAYCRRYLSHMTTLLAALRLRQRRASDDEVASVLQCVEDEQHRH